MAQGCISVIEMTVSACLVQEHSHFRVMLEGKKLPRFDVSKAGQWVRQIHLSVWLLTSEGRRTIQDGAD